MHWILPESKRLRSLGKWVAQDTERASLYHLGYFGCHRQEANNYKEKFRYFTHSRVERASLASRQHRTHHMEPHLDRPSVRSLSHGAVSMHPKRMSIENAPIVAPSTSRNWTRQCASPHERFELCGWYNSVAWRANGRCSLRQLRICLSIWRPDGYRTFVL